MDMNGMHRIGDCSTNDESVTASGLAGLERRMASLEAELEHARAEVAMLRSQPRWRHGGAIATAMVAAVVAGLGLAQAVPSATAPVGPLTVRAPFIVQDAAGNPLLSVTEEGVEEMPDEPMTFKTPFEVQDSSGKVVLSVTDSGVQATSLSAVAPFSVTDGRQVGMMVVDEQNGGAVLRLNKPGISNSGITLFSEAARATTLIGDSKGLRSVTYASGAKAGFKALDEDNVSSAIGVVGGTAMIVALGSDGRGTDIRSDGGPNNAGGLSTYGGLLVLEGDAKKVFLASPGENGVGEDGKPVSSPRGITVFNEAEQVAVRAAVDDGGRGFVMARSGPPKSAVAGLMVTEKGSQLSLADTAGKIRADLRSHDGLLILNSAGSTVANLSSQGEAGYLELNDAGAQQMVVARSESGEGYVDVNKPERN
jgi:anti-sigma-K factor RskA